MPDTSETAGLQAQIEALIRKASDHLRRQIEDVRLSSADNRYDQPEQLKEAS
jgi:membrane protein YdbS with pleckstrin-like domain